jgi:hypothetical protein
MKTIKTDNGDLKIRSNYHARPLVNGFELTEKEKQDFGYLENIDEGIFFRFKGQVYDLNEFMAVDKNSPFPAFWHGYSSDTFFSGILIHLCDDNDLNRISGLSFPDNYIIVGQYFS